MRRVRSNGLVARQITARLLSRCISRTSLLSTTTRPSLIPGLTRLVLMRVSSSRVLLTRLPRQTPLLRLLRLLRLSRLSRLHRKQLRLLLLGKFPYPACLLALCLTVLVLLEVLSLLPTLPPRLALPPALALTPALALAPDLARFLLVPAPPPLLRLLTRLRTWALVAWVSCLSLRLSPGFFSCRLVT